MDDREAEENERERLMGKRKLDRNSGEQRRNAKRGLEDSDGARTSLSHRIIQPKVRSTIQRRGKILKTGSVVRRRSIAMAKLKECRLIHEMARSWAAKVERGEWTLEI